MEGKGQVGEQGPGDITGTERFEGEEKVSVEGNNQNAQIEIEREGKS